MPTIKPYIPTEEEEQMVLISWAELESNRHYPELAYLFHVPNGGHRNKATAGRMKAAGVKPGVPDLCLPVPRGGFHGLYIEMKRSVGGAPSADQKDWLNFLACNGYKTAVCHGFEAAKAVIIEYLEGGKDCAESNEQNIYL